MQRLAAVGLVLLGVVGLARDLARHDGLDRLVRAAGAVPSTRPFIAPVTSEVPEGPRSRRRALLGAPR